MPSTLLPNFLIGLREGLEAALVVSILVAFLVHTKRRDRLPLVWAGVAAAVTISASAGAALTFVWSNVDSYHQQELMGGVLSLVAVFFVTWMIFWMRRTARHLKSDLTGRLENAISLGPTAVALAACLTVGREGLETTLLFWVAAQNARSTVYPLAGFLIGIAVAVVLAYLLYRSAIRINLRRFFTVTSVGLIIVAAGIASYGIHDLQEAGYLGGMSHMAWDISGSYDESSWYGVFFAGVFNFKAQTTWYQAFVWLAYLGGTLTAYFFPTRKKTPASTASSEAVAPKPGTKTVATTSASEADTNGTSVAPRQSDPEFIEATRARA